ncbi:protein CHUP1, chloroplastic-like [Juglans microcarpa x Juglans regia]|uniref:protein CHUP1, chloroplastic-like n=1 Tax=Juglans microcarpa x Juglans regia TaxID=2249226 RepID=UPI001B7E47FE|nr:protein CHUP1, chloroplastic-like [Juglans microcarpa x Juglans regia]
MVAGKVREAMGLQKSPARSKQEMPPKPPLPSPSSGKVPQKASISRTFGVYFPRSSAQVQPRPPDVTELLRLVEELRERESLLKTELLEHKLLKESVAIVPVLENEISVKDAELYRASKRVECLEIENQTLRMELEGLKTKMDTERKEGEEKVKAMEAEISELKRTASDHYRAELILDSDELSSSQRFQGLMEVSIKSNLIKNLKKGTKCTESGSIFENQKLEGPGSKKEDTEIERPRHSRCNSEDLTESSEPTLSNLRSRPPRVPKPPPRPSSSTLSAPTSSNGPCTSSESKAPTEQTVPPPPPPPKKMAPPPPPPPPKGLKGLPAKVRRVPEVVEFYHSLMRRDSRKDSSATATASDAAPATANARDMIGEIENRSTHLIAIKSDVETQGDFIRFLIKEVENAAFADIEDVVPFVKWLDDELSYLVDERAVLKHFNWPEQKADALREAAFGYADLKKLESEASSFRDDARQPSGPALKKMQALLEKLEHGVYNVSRMRESATRRYKVFNIPTDWMLDSGYVSQSKLASVKLAMKYMKRVSAELETVGSGPEEEELIVQCVRFAFRVHQFAGGFDVETMRAFQELRDKAKSCHVQCQNRQQQKLVCRSTTPC